MNSCTLLASILLCLAYSFRAEAQFATTSSGGEAKGSGGSVSYSIGQVIFKNTSGASGSASAGVQHGYQIIVMGVEADPEISLTIFPNPTPDNLNLLTPDFAKSHLSYRLLDFRGQVLKSEMISSRETVVEMAGLPVAVYLVCVLKDNQPIQSFKVIKK